jgi:hypothetical protein
VVLGEGHLNVIPVHLDKLFGLLSPVRVAEAEIVRPSPNTPLMLRRFRYSSLWGSVDIETETPRASAKQGSIHITHLFADNP